MIEVECPTCETRFIVSGKKEVGNKVECPSCGELLRITTLDPLEVDYWDEEEEEEEEATPEEPIVEDTSEIIEEEFPREVNIEDEENESFELPEKSPLFDDYDDIDEEEEEWEEETTEEEEEEDR